MLILLNKKATGLFKLIIAASVKTNKVWKPQKGEIPTKIPRAIAEAFLCGES